MLSIEVVAILWGLCATSLAWGWMEARRTQQLRLRMERLKVAPIGTAEASRVLDTRFIARGLGATLRRRVPRLSQRRGVLAVAAGTNEAMAEELIGWRAVIILAGLVLGLTITVGWHGGIAPLLGCPVVAWIIFEVWLRRRAASRSRAIEGGLLTVMDLLGLSLGAGMGLDRALRLICERVDSPLTDELRVVLAEIDLGVPRREAFTHLAERLDLEDIRALTTAIVQADELSTSMVDSMRIQVHGLRVKRRQEAEAIAQRAPVMMLFPMVIFVLPALFIIVLAPAAFQLVKVFPR